MKKVYLFAVMSAMLTACTQTEELNSVVNNTPEESSAINFDVYTSRATRAGTAGTITTDDLKTGTHKDDGFGIFAYYTDNGTYDQYYKPNFMYNQQVKYDGTSKWVYEPVKYWPNEFGNAAQSDDVDHVSFFAYAPYVNVVPNTGAIDVTGLTPAQTAQAQNYNITGMSHNATTGDPLIKYVVDWAPATSVDLLWGVDAMTGLPFMNQVKQGLDGKLTFNLKHALSKLNIQIDAFVDKTDATNVVDAKTKIWVRSITFEGFATKGSLNLNNTTANKPLWMDYAGSNELSTEAFTIYDGRKDGKEGYALNDGTATNEKVLGLNPVIVQPGPYDITTDATKLGATQNGVTNSAVNLFGSGTATDPIFVIPTSETMKVTIVYDVETWDDNLSDYLADGVVHGSTIENKITKTITDGTGANLTMEAGKGYQINLHLGMTSVKVDASVTNWDDTNITNPSDVDLPENYLAARAAFIAGGFTGTVTYDDSATPITVSFAETSAANAKADIVKYLNQLGTAGGATQFKIGTTTYIYYAGSFDTNGDGTGTAFSDTDTTIAAISAAGSTNITVTNLDATTTSVTLSYTGF